MRAFLFSILVTHLLLRGSLTEAALLNVSTNGEVEMRKMDIADATDAITGMLTLRAVLTEELDNIETSIQEIADSDKANSDAGINDLKVYWVARAAVYSGLAGINELLSWVSLLTEKDAEGNAFEVTRLLPAMPAWSIN
jgi:hypothetical protein